jgi:hypothetical protein
VYIVDGARGWQRQPNMARVITAISNGDALPYTFLSVEQLAEDFIAEVSRSK